MSAAGATGGSDQLLAWGNDSSGQLGIGFTTPYTTSPTTTLLPTGVTPTAVAGAGSTSSGDPVGPIYAGFALGSDGNVYSWGNLGALGNDVNVGDGTVPVRVALPTGVTATAITGANGVGFAIGSDGHLYAWGQNNVFGLLGDGSTGGSTLPVQVSLPTGVTPLAVAGGYESAYAIGSDGHLYAWGDNLYGELGNGGVSPDTCSPSSACSRSPVEVSLPAGVTPTAVAGGGGFAEATGSDGHLYAWGIGTSGQLGDGNATGSNTPVLVALPSGIAPKAVSAGLDAAYAIGSDDNLYAWGGNSSGQLGDGDPFGRNSSTPVLVSLQSGVAPTAVTGGQGFALAIGSDDNLYAWGGNSSGQLGNGGTTNRLRPFSTSLPSGTLPLALGPEPGSLSSYVIATNPPESAPSITTQPSDQTAFAGQDATFTAGASGFPAPTVQWEVSTDSGASFSPLAGATAVSLKITGTTLAENGNEYRAVFSNGVSPDATSTAATLTVNPSVAPTITLNPVSQSVTVGDTVTFTAAASGAPTPTVRWQVSVDGGATWIDATGQTSTTLTGQPTPFVNGWEFRAVFTNVAGSAATGAATLTELPPVAPVITLQPVSQTVLVGDTVTFTAAASGDPTPTVLWQVSVDGGATWIDATGHTSTTLTGQPTPFVNGWEFRAVFTNIAGSAVSDAATLTET